MDPDWKRSVTAQMLNKYFLVPNDHPTSYLMLYLRHITYIIDVDIPYLFTDFFSYDDINKDNFENLLELLINFNPNIFIDNYLIIPDSKICEERDFIFYELDDEMIKNRKRKKVIMINNKEYEVLRVMVVCDDYLDILYTEPMTRFKKIYVEDEETKTEEVNHEEEETMEIENQVDDVNEEEEKETNSVKPNKSTNMSYNHFDIDSYYAKLRSMPSQCSSECCNLV